MTGLGFWRDHGKQFNKLFHIDLAISITIEKAKIFLNFGDFFGC